MTDTVDRRAFLLLGVGVVLAGCSSSATPSASSPAGTRTSRAATPSQRSTTPGAPGSQPALPAVTPWLPNRDDIQPGVKLVAARAVEALGNHPGSALQVIEAQYGGLLAEAASVLVVCAQWREAADGTVRSGGATFDVRVRRATPRWQVTAIHPSRPGSAAPTLSPHAREVLASTRIELPPASRADVRSGRVHDSVLAAMLGLSDTFRIGVSVVRSGHPKYVFGTHRLSDHPLGRAFDTWRIDDRMVVDPATPRSLVTDYMVAAAAAGSYNVGGPYLLGAAPQYFTDRTHHDHVHAGFSA